MDGFLLFRQPDVQSPAVGVGEGSDMAAGEIADGNVIKAMIRGDMVGSESAFVHICRLTDRSL